MGYPMSYRRAVRRNYLLGDYGDCGTRPKPEMQRHDFLQPYPGTGTLDQVLMDVLWSDASHEQKLKILGTIPSVASTIEFYEKSPQHDGGTKPMATRRFLEAVEYAAQFNLRGTIAGDLRRVERDQLDDSHLDFYAEKAGITKDQAKAVLEAFFGEAQ